MLVTKGEYLARKNNDDTATIFEVLLADEELFCVGEVTGVLDDEGEVHQHTDYINLAIYSNKENIGSLKQYGFEKEPRK